MKNILLLLAKLTYAIDKVDENLTRNPTQRDYIGKEYKHEQ